jgi:hypothetical protein
VREKLFAQRKHRSGNHFDYMAPFRNSRRQPMSLGGYYPVVS